MKFLLIPNACRISVPLKNYYWKHAPLPWTSPFCFETAAQHAPSLAQCPKFLDRRIKTGKQCSETSAKYNWLDAPCQQTAAWWTLTPARQAWMPAPCVGTPAWCAWTPARWVGLMFIFQYVTALRQQPSKSTNTAGINSYSTHYRHHTILFKPTRSVWRETNKGF